MAEITLLNQADGRAKWRELVQENRRYRRRAQLAEGRLERLQRVVAEQNRQLLGVWLRGVLADPADFERYVNLGSVLGEDGEIVWAAVDREVERLLGERPYLATQEENPWSRGTSAIEWFTTEER
ncbi:hypothetical protein [Microbacterium sp. XT11]|uniref:hypothetical protein n=1 Tax=Microbacterium sp. XT11 TaxID=367477 RepID=UPI000834F9FA|nr:hypothetical protein [Microbacterium sp. XT11]